jgi:8-oxo-dGTP pyrophosphatase MutT (NUDIX family)
LILDPEQVRRDLSRHTCRRIDQGVLKPSAVLLLFYPKNGVDTILFTRRAEHLPHHAGEIAFPGGRAHPTDDGLCATALRETEEEMGVRQEDVTILGRLDDFISVYGFHVVPFVGTIPAGYPFSVNRHEIAEVIEVPVAHLRDPRIYRTENWEHLGRLYPVCFFTIEDYQIWGLTGAILRQFLQRIGQWPPGLGVRP